MLQAFRSNASKQPYAVISQKPERQQILVSVSKTETISLHS